MARLRRYRGIVLLVGALAVPGLVLGLLGAGASYESAPERAPQSVSTSGVPQPTARPPAKAPPTYGEFVPPRPKVTPRPTRTRKAERPRRPRHTARPPQRRCPEEWRDIPWLRKWCERNGYSIG